MFELFLLKHCVLFFINVWLRYVTESFVMVVVFHLKIFNTSSIWKSSMHDILSWHIKTFSDMSPLWRKSTSHRWIPCCDFNTYFHIEIMMKNDLNKVQLPCISQICQRYDHFLGVGISIIFIMGILLVIISLLKQHSEGSETFGTVKSRIQGEPNPKTQMFLISNAVVFVQSIEARC